MDEQRVWGKRDQPTESWEDIAATELQHWERLQRAEERVDALDCSSSLAEWGAVMLPTADPLEKAVLTHHAYRLL